MNGTELQALRRLLFFQVPEAAAMISGTSERAWKHWEAGARPVPEDVAARVRELLAWRLVAIEDTIDLIETQIHARGAPESARLVWYGRMQDWPGEPVMWRPHQSVCAAVAEEVERVVLVPFDGPGFAAWLGDRADSQAMRAAWAGELEMGK